MKVKQIPGIPELLYGKEPETGDIHFLWPELMKFLGKSSNHGAKGISSHTSQENRRNGPVEYPSGMQAAKVNSISIYGLWQYLPKAHRGKDDSNRMLLTKWINDHMSLKVDDDELEVEEYDDVADNETIIEPKEHAVLEAEEEEKQLKGGNEKEPELLETVLEDVVIDSEDERKWKTVTFILDDVVVVEEFVHETLYPHNDEFIHAIFAGAVGMGETPPSVFIKEGMAMKLGLTEKEAEEARARHNKFEEGYKKKLLGLD